MKPIFSKGILAAAAFVGFLSLPLIAGAQSDSQGLGGRPALPRADEPRSDSIFIHTLEPGQQVKDAVLVVNNTQEAKKVRVYSTDSMLASGGTFTCEQFGDTKDEVGAWVSLTQEPFVLDAQSSQQVPFAVAVPTGTAVGQKDGCIVVEEQPDEEALQPGINIQTRSGIRLSIMVPGDEIRSLRVTDFKIDKTGQEPVLALTVLNEGNVDLPFYLHLVVRTVPFGRGVMSDGGEFLTLAGQSSTYNFKIPKTFWGGWLKATTVIEVDGQGYTGMREQVVAEKDMMRMTGANFDDRMKNHEHPSWADENNLPLAGPSLVTFVMPAAGALAIYAAVLAFIIVLIILLVRHAAKGRSTKKK